MALTAAVLTAGAPAVARGAPQAPADLLDVPKLLEDLSNTDTAVRDGASEKLAAIGEAARPELIKAARSDDPEQRTRAAELLRKLPWYTNKDPQPIRTLLERYGPADDRTRMGLLWQVSDATGGDDVLIRLLSEEPNQGIRWFITALLANDHDQATQKKILALAATLPVEATTQSSGGGGDDAPVLVLLGNILIERDRAKALDFFRRAIDAEERRPGADIGVLAFAFDALVDDSLRRGDVEGAAAVLRRQVPRDDLPHNAYRPGYGQNEPNALARLMALHTYFGPLRDYERDIAAWGQGRIVALPLRMQIAQLLGKFGAAPPLPWQPRELTGEEHLAAGAFLLRNKLHFPAESELHKALAAPAKENPFLIEANALFALGQSTGERDDDEVAAAYLERAMQIKRTRDLSFGMPSRRADDDVWAEIHWRRARAATARGDNDAAAASVKNLLQLLPTNSDLTISVINWLKESNRAAEAKVMFEKVHIQSNARLDAAPDDEKAGMKNDLAWLCARVGEHVDEAVKLAGEAVEAQPENAAFLDTLGEACFRAGKIDEAIAHEARALELEPDNTFMKQQIERFRAGKRHD